MKKNMVEMITKFKLFESVRLAPNGQPSNLNQTQYDLVRTPEFKKWFGDWENDPEDSSKIIDENGEPMICFHGTKSVFYEFDEYEIGKETDSGYYGKGFYFTDYEQERYGSRIIKAFLSIKNPCNHIESYKVYQLNTEELKSKGFDGVVVYGDEDSKNIIGELVVYNSNQIKLADGTNTTFDKYNDDIRF